MKSLKLHSWLKMTNIFLRSILRGGGIFLWIALSGCFSTSQSEGGRQASAQSNVSEQSEVSAGHTSPSPVLPPVSSPPSSPEEGADSHFSGRYYLPQLMDDLTIQLTVDDAHPLVMPTDSQVIEIDLFDTSEETILRLKSQAKVLCYFSAGSFEDWRPDADRFPAQLLGNDYEGWAGEKWLDIRSDALKPILKARFDLAKNKGCDGVDPDNVNGYTVNTGFPLIAEDQLQFNRWLAQQAHSRGLFIALKNDGEQAAQLVSDFDAVVSEECYQYQECSLFEDFVTQNKPVWDLEYDNRLGQGEAWNNFCLEQNQHHLHAYWLPQNLDGSFRHSCQVKDQMWNDLSLGIGGGSSFKFLREDSGFEYMEVSDLILNPNLTEVPRYQKIKAFDKQAFRQLHQSLAQADFVTMWLTPNWQPSWFNVETLTELVQAGKGLVFNYWYFGDKLASHLPTEQEKTQYLENVKAVGQLLKQIPGPKWVNFEPEFNKSSVLASAETQRQLIDLMRAAIATLKAEDDQIQVSLTMMDRGRRSLYDTDTTCGYANCALGDKDAWGETSEIYQALLEQLDYLSFQQMVGQFSRDPLNPGDWNHPNPKGYLDGEIGIDVLAERIVNFAEYLSQKYHKPVMLPYLAIATATWQDANDNGQIESSEIDPTGWEGKLLKTVRALKSPTLTKRLRAIPFMGISMMELFDDPQHDAGGYRFFMQNECHLGWVASGAQCDVDLAAWGNIRMKGDGTSSAVEILLQKP